VNLIAALVDGIAIGVVAQAFADARRQAKEVARSKQAVADMLAHLDAVHAKADAILDNAPRGQE
jgi:hypothetical protein